jgi:hypothetical protein
MVAKGDLVQQYECPLYNRLQRLLPTLLKMMFHSLSNLLPGHRAYIFFPPQYSAKNRGKSPGEKSNIYIKIFRSLFALSVTIPETYSLATF